MIFLEKEDYARFQYTKIQVPLTLEACPSDRKDSSSCLDVNCDALCQQGCYVGTQRVEQLHIRRIRKARGDKGTVPAKWDAEIVLAGARTEDEALKFLDELCFALSLACGRYRSVFQYSGLAGFSYRSMEVKRSYAAGDGRFGDTDFNFSCGYVEIHSLNTLPEEVFVLPKSGAIRPAFSRALDRAFLTAMRSHDAVSRYILLYYLFEMMYGTEEYQSLKRAQEAAPEGGKKSANQKRSEILCRYLQQQFGVTGYESFDRQLPLTPEILCEIITTRNDLTHRADTSKINEMMYHHMLPILQGVLEA